MKIALIGYGKMGKTIEKIALSKGHEIVYKTDIPSARMIMDGVIDHADVAIEFTHPEAAPSNIMACVGANIPVVSGTTGWLKSHWESVKEFCEANNGSFFYASNFSIGVNIFFEVNKYLAKLMNKHNQYKASITEIHHTEKKDAPSGTAITMADGILLNNSNYTKWVNTNSDIQQELPIISLREPHVPGTHIVEYQSEIDFIKMEHTAHSRLGFAQGAAAAAHFIYGKKGIFEMKDLLAL